MEVSRRSRGGGAYGGNDAGGGDDSGGAEGNGNPLDGDACVGGHEDVFGDVLLRQTPYVKEGLQNMTGSGGGRPGPFLNSPKTVRLSSSPHLSPLLCSDYHCWTPCACCGHLPHPPLPQALWPPLHKWSWKPYILLQVLHLHFASCRCASRH